MFEIQNFVLVRNMIVQVSKLPPIAQSATQCSGCIFCKYTILIRTNKLKTKDYKKLKIEYTFDTDKDCVSLHDILPPVREDAS
jgi:hypothetical protein